MSHVIVDRTESGKNKSSANRDKFMRRASDKVKEALRDYITNDADIESISDGKQKRIKVPGKTLNEPVIVYDSEGNVRDDVHIGNKDFEAGDRMRKPPQDKDGRGGAGPGEEDEDDFYFTLSHDEFLDLFFDGLELPDLIKKQLKEDTNFETRPAGYSTEGPPCRLDLRKTMFNSLKRNFAIVSEINKEIEDLTLKLQTADEEETVLILTRMEELQQQRSSIPFIQELDLRFRKTEQHPLPCTKAVMFSIMDVSGSMTQWHKELAKRFFMILYLFLTKQYETVDIVFIKHHHDAFEVSEQDFFYSRDSGGTVVSSALELTRDIIKQRYDLSKCNMYICQMSDGDDFDTEDEFNSVSECVSELLTMVQYFAYVEVDSKEENVWYGRKKGEDSTLMGYYNKIKSTVNSEKFNIRRLQNPNDVFNIFRSLFSKEES